MEKYLSNFSSLSGLRRWAVLAMLSTASLPVVTAADAEPQPERIALWAGQAPVGDGTFAAADAFITVHRPAQPNGTAVVICPGGGYGGLVVKPEGHGIRCGEYTHSNFSMAQIGG